jgi:hypothetical protein
MCIHRTTVKKLCRPANLRRRDDDIVTFSMTSELHPCCDAHNDCESRCATTFPVAHKYTKLIVEIPIQVVRLRGLS